MTTAPVLPRKRIAVLASGEGSNLQAIIDHFAALGESRAGDVVLVASDREGAGALRRAAIHGVPSALIRTPAHPSRPDLLWLLREHSIDIVALAGYLRLVEPAVVNAYEERIFNVHPALLPAFGGHGMYGSHVHEAVLDSGTPVTGVTVHSVDGEYDRGRIVAQWPVPVLPGDDVKTLSARVLRVEHLLFPRVLDAVAAGHIASTVTATARPSAGDLSSSALADRADTDLAAAIDRMLRDAAAGRS